MIDWIFPLLAGTIYIFTPKGCDRTINWILTGLFVLIWSFEEAIVRVNEGMPVPILTDGAWYDLTLFSLFALVSVLFYRAGGKVQFKLSALGAGLCLLYAAWGDSGLYYDASFRSNHYYIEVMVALYLAQLFVAGGGMMYALSNKWMGGGKHGVISSHNRHMSRRSHVNHGDS